MSSLQLCGSYLWVVPVQPVLMQDAPVTSLTSWLHLHHDQLLSNSFVEHMLKRYACLK